MNYKFNLGSVSFTMPGDVKVEVKDVGVELTDMNLKEIPSIIKETRKVIKEVKSVFEEETYEADLEHQMSRDEDSFLEFLDGMLRANIAHEEEEQEEECFANAPTHSMAKFLQEAILQDHPGAKIIPTPNGFAVAVPAKGVKL